MKASSNIRALQLGDEAPNFKAMTTKGELDFHEYIGDSWCVFFSHPRDFTPVCTTELGEAAKLQQSFSKRNVKVIALSVDSADSHKEWIKDIEQTQKTKVDFPIIGDEQKEISELYGMIHPNTDSTHTVRSVFIIDSNKKVRLIMTYPMTTGRNFAEILRVIDSMQLTDRCRVATPVNWRDGDDCVIPPAITDPEELKANYPKGWKTLTPYLRMTPQPDPPSGKGFEKA